MEKCYFCGNDAFDFSNLDGVEICSSSSDKEVNIITCVKSAAINTCDKVENGVCVGEFKDSVEVPICKRCFVDALNGFNDIFMTKEFEEGDA